MFDDVKLRKAGLDELNREPSVPAGQIGVTAGGGVVTLTGHAGSYAAKYAAERAAARGEDIKAIAEDDGTVRLIGSVDSLRDRTVADKTTWAAPGAVQAQNLLEVV